MLNLLSEQQVFISHAPSIFQFFFIIRVILSFITKSDADRKQNGFHLDFYSNFYIQ